MLVSVKQLCGIGGVPSHRDAGGKWLRRHGVSVSQVSGRGGIRDAVDLADLPAQVRHAYLAKCAGEMNLDMGRYDDAAHETFLSAPVTMRAEAERKAAIACVLVALGGTMPWKAKAKTVRERFGDKGTSTQSLKRISKAVEGIDPINFAPALVANFKPNNANPSDVTDKAWSMFMTTIRDAAPTFPLRQAWRDVHDVAQLEGWSWPSFSTIWRRWSALPEAQRLAAQHGEGFAAKRLAQPALRDKTTILPLEYVSLDGRLQDYWTDMGDGKPVRLTMIALVDVASNLILGYELASSENANSTVRLVRKVCEEYGIFDRVYTDNGSSFAGHLVAGGVDHKFRNAKTNTGMRPPGICKILGINVTFALPGNAQAKIAERVFATLSRSLDDRPEFASAHAGHDPGTSPTPDVKPVPFETVERLVAREVRRYNALRGRRGQAMGGRSYQDVFENGLSKRTTRRPTARQLYLSSLVYSPVAVDRHGRVKVDGWTYGASDTQEKLLRFHGKGRKILLGRDPDDLSAPALAFDAEWRLICEGIQYVRRGAYDSKDGIRDASRNRKAARLAVKQAVDANAYLDKSEMEAAMAQLDAAADQIPPVNVPNGQVVAGAFAFPLKPTAQTENEASESMVSAEMLENLDRSLGLSPQRIKGGR